MKKLLLMLAAVAALCFVSCDDKKANQTETTEDSTFVVEKFATSLDSLAAASDSAGIATLLDGARVAVDNLMAKGDTVAANDLYAKIMQVIDTNKEKIVAAMPAFAEMATKVMPESLKSVAAATGDSLAAGAKDALNEVKDAAAEKVNEAADKVVEGAKDAADKAAEKVNDAAQKGAEKVNEAAAKGAEAASKAANDLKKKLP